MPKAKPAPGSYPVFSGDFDIEYRPDATKVNKAGTVMKAQEVNIVLKEYKGDSTDKRFVMWRKEYNDIMSCDAAAGWPEKGVGSKTCSPPTCKIVGKGKYKVGGMTESNPVELTFDGGEWIKLNLVGTKIHPETCDDLSKFKI